MGLSRINVTIAVSVNLTSSVRPGGGRRIKHHLTLITLINDCKGGISNSTPMFQGCEVGKSGVRLSFKRGRSKFRVGNAALGNFAVTKPSHIFCPTRTVIRGKGVVIFSPRISVPLTTHCN